MVVLLAICQHKSPIIHTNGSSRLAMDSYKCKPLWADGDCLHGDIHDKALSFGALRGSMGGWLTRLRLRPLWGALSYIPLHP